MDPFNLRLAELSDIPALEELIRDSARQLNKPFYTTEQIEAALQSAWGVDTQLIRDKTYFVIENAGLVVACGGWSRRKTLFGSDAHAEREPDLLDPNIEAARIRAFFVRPGWERKGLATALLKHCEAQAQNERFSQFTLAATLSGEKFYGQFGYEPAGVNLCLLPAGLEISFVNMSRVAKDT